MLFDGNPLDFQLIKIQEVFGFKSMRKPLKRCFMRKSHKRFFKRFPYSGNYIDFIITRIKEKTIIISIIYSALIFYR